MTSVDLYNSNQKVILNNRSITENKNSDNKKIRKKKIIKLDIKLEKTTNQLSKRPKEYEYKKKSININKTFKKFERFS